MRPNGDPGFYPARFTTVLSREKIDSGIWALVVDDDEFPRSIIPRHLLRGTKFEGVFVVENGEEAIACYRENFAKISFITMDYQMPKMTGDVVIKNILEFAAERKYTPYIVGVTSEEDAAILQSMQNAGAQKIFNKPRDYHLIKEHVCLHFPLVGAADHAPST